MSDKTKDTPTQTQNRPGSDSQAPTSNPPVVVNVQGNQGSDSGGRVGKTEDEVNALIEAARKEEKDKLYAKLEKEREEREALEVKAAEAAKAQAEAQAKLAELEDSKLTEAEKVRKELDELRSKNEDLSSQVENVVDVAAQKIHAFEMDAYRKSRFLTLEQSGEGLVMTDLVVGNTKEEIDASIAAVQQREKAIYEKAHKAAFQQAQEELSQGVPRPRGQDPRGVPVSSTLQITNKRNLASLKGDDYQKARQQLMEAARGKGGSS